MKKAIYNGILCTVSALHEPITVPVGDFSEKKKTI